MFHVQRAQIVKLGDVKKRAPAEGEEAATITPVVAHTQFRRPHLCLPELGGNSGNSLQHSGNQTVHLDRQPSHSTTSLAGVQQGKHRDADLELACQDPTGAHYVSAHKDDEPSLDPTAPILSFSFGGVRKFRVRKGGEIVHDFQTEDQSVLIMGGDMQKHFMHEITKTLKEVGPRINITVRSFIK